MSYVYGEARRQAEARKAAAVAKLAVARSEYQEIMAINREAEEAEAEARRIHQELSNVPNRYGGREGLRRAAEEARGHGRPKKGT